MTDYGLNTGRVVEYETDDYFVRSMESVKGQRGNGRIYIIITHKPTGVDFMIHGRRTHWVMLSYIDHDHEVYHYGDYNEILKFFPSISDHLMAIFVAANLHLEENDIRIYSRIVLRHSNRILVCNADA
jgi:hypothetical protein